MKFANAIVNKLKKNYAWAYLNYAAGKTQEKPDPRGLSDVAAGIIRQSVDNLLEKAYPGTYQPPKEEPSHGATSTGRDHATPARLQEPDRGGRNRIT